MQRMTTVGNPAKTPENEKNRGGATRCAAGWLPCSGQEERRQAGESDAPEEKPDGTLHLAWTWRGLDTKAPHVLPQRKKGVGVWVPNRIRSSSYWPQAVVDWSDRAYRSSPALSPGVLARCQGLLVLVVVAWYKFRGPPARSTEECPVLAAHFVETIAQARVLYRF